MLSIIKPSSSPWRAQVLIANDGSHKKKHLVINYSRTINRFTLLDAYPLPQTDDLINEISTAHEIEKPSNTRMAKLFVHVSMIGRCASKKLERNETVHGAQRYLDQDDERYCS